MLFAEQIHDAERLIIVAALLVVSRDSDVSPEVRSLLGDAISKVDRARELMAVVHGDDNTAHQLEAKAIELIKKYGRFLPGPAKEFFRELAGFLNWDQLKKEL